MDENAPLFVDYIMLIYIRDYGYMIYCMDFLCLFHMCTDNCTDITDEEWLSILNKIIQWRFLGNPGLNNLAARFSMQIGSFGS